MKESDFFATYLDLELVSYTADNFVRTLDVFLRWLSQNKCTCDGDVLEDVIDKVFAACEPMQKAYNAMKKVIQ